MDKVRFKIIFVNLDPNQNEGNIISHRMLPNVLISRIIFQVFEETGNVGILIDETDYISVDINIDNNINKNILNVINRIKTSSWIYDNNEIKIANVETN